MSKNFPAKTGLMIGISIMLLLSGCGSRQIQESPEELRDTGETEKKESEIPEAEAEDQENGSEEKEAGENAPLLLYYKKKLIQVDDNGQVQELLTAGEGEKIRAACYEDGRVCYIVEDYADDWSYLYRAYIKDLEKDAEPELVREAVSTWGGWVEFYDGVLYQGYSGYDDAGEIREYSESYTFNEDGGYLKGDGFTDLQSSFTEQGYTGIYTYNTYCSIPYLLKNCGKILLWDKERENIAAFTAEGQLLETVPMEKKNAQICGVNDRYLIYSCEGDRPLIYDSYPDPAATHSDSIYNTVIYDWESGIKKILYQGKASEQMVILALEDDAVYYYRTQMPEYEWELRQVYRYDIAAEKESFLYEAYDVPGDTYLETGIAGFQVKDGVCCYLSAGGKDFQWYRLDSNQENPKEEPLGVVESHFDFLDYGTVDYTAGRHTYEESDVELFGYYIEEFAFGNQYEHAWEANEYLRLRAQENRDAAQKHAEEVKEEVAGDEDIPEIIREGYWIGHSYTVNLDSVEDIGKGHYISVNYSGYEFWGGAHGMPFREYYLFDMDTGEAVSLKELYTDTEEAFKQLVAEYSVADWKEKEDYYFGWDSEEAAYQEFYENASFAMPMRFTEDCLVVEYPPYQYGPYASGYIDIFIPYGELGLFGE